MAKKAGWLRYLKEAFLFRWNLLLFGGAAAAAVLSGHADIALPLVAAGEVAYLAGLGSMPRFQGAIDAKAAAEERGAGPAGATVDPRIKLKEMLESLDPDRRNRFLRLRARCLEMQRIGHAVRGDTRDSGGHTAQLRTPAIDRMLWVFLRLLLSAQALEKFLRTSEGAKVGARLDELRAKEKAAADKGNERVVRSLRDMITTAELRLENHSKAESNAEFVTVELDRIENKIHALTEMAISHEDPDIISAQVDAVAEGISQTEATIRELHAITGVADIESTPEILDTDVNEVVQS